LPDTGKINVKNVSFLLITKSEEENVVGFVKLPPKMLNSSLADS